MKKQITTLLAGAILMMATGATATPLSLDFNYNSKTYGTMVIDVSGESQLSIKYSAANASGVGQATGFGFAFNPNSTVPASISNPTNIAFSDDNNDLNWIKLTNLNAIPNPANSTSTKADFYFGATEGRANNFTPPGITANSFDIFYLNFNDQVFTSTIDLSNFVDLAGVRLQSLPDSVNGGSLFLVGTPINTPVPEPGTMMLLGVGMLGLAIYGKRRLS